MCQQCVINVVLVVLLSAVSVCYSTKDLCHPDRHYFTNCSDPCRQGENIVHCASNPGAVCKPGYCGGCVPRFFDQDTNEVHCEKEDGVICEMKTRTIGCVKGKNEVIAVTWANYGRTSKTICEHPFGTEKLHSDTNCRAVDSISVVRNLCQEKVECTFTVDNKLFKNDPCFGVYKYLEVEFECVPPEMLSGEQSVNRKGNALLLALASLTTIAFLRRQSIL